MNGPIEWPMNRKFNNLGNFDVHLLDDLFLML
jgi:hypothetical protein